LVICDLTELRTMLAGANTVTKQIKLNRAVTPYSTIFFIGY